MSERRQSELERIKLASRHLRGSIAEGLLDPVTGNVSDADFQLLKFHGVYRQDNRDIRDERRHQKLEPDYQYMVRLRLPGGVLRAAQWLALDQIAEEFGGGTLRITTRQSVQIHGVRKHRLRAAIAAINKRAGLDTRGACGDVNRNVICSVNPHESALHADVYAQARAVSDHLLWQSGAYRELWLDGKGGYAVDEEPAYGDSYLPRKFKVAFAVPPVNDVDVLANDLGFSALADKGRLAGYNVTVGGGMGMSYDEEKTYPRLASPVGFIAEDQVLSVVDAVVGIQRDYGNRSDRKRARLKYTLDDRGLDWFRKELTKRLGYELSPSRPIRFDHNGDRLGWIEGADSRRHLTLLLPAGRVTDGEAARWRSGLCAIAQVHSGEFRLTTNQNLTVADVAAEDVEKLDDLVAKYGLDAYRKGSALRRRAMACVALPTCGLAMAEAERYLPALMEKIEALLDRHGLLQAPITLRVSGCPNGCARPYLGEIALAGKAPGRYNLYLGAGFAGERMNTLYRENIAEPEILAALEPLLARYAAERETGERFGDFLHRIGIVTDHDFHHATVHERG